MYQHPYIAQQIVRDRHETIRRQAGASRLRRESRALIRLQRERSR
jgi:hypothetical protein